ncbi:MAG: hypothetical protein ACYCZI_02550 [Metallibacterium scheffleri]
MNMKYSKILVCCSTSVTGGPELLHQLVHELRHIGHDAYIAYYPFDQTHHCPEPYRCYDAPQSQLMDESDVLVVMPEVATWIGRHLKNAQGAIWWLSVDNYLERRGESWLRDFYMHMKGFVRPRNFSQRKMTIFTMKKYLHFFQSEYAMEFLARRGVSGLMLTDYLSDIYLDGVDNVNLSEKQNIICFNPKKGIKKTDTLRRAYPELEFVPIQGLNRDGVYGLLCRSKIYMDFGNHPGKDRLPREAAMAGCCVITGRRGSARNSTDVPLPQRFKLDDSGDGYIAAFGPLVREVFSGFSGSYRELAEYREKIKQEKAVFKQEVRDIVGLVKAKKLGDE